MACQFDNGPSPSPSLTLTTQQSGLTRFTTSSSAPLEQFDLRKNPLTALGETHYLQNRDPFRAGHRDRYLSSPVDWHWHGCVGSWVTLTLTDGVATDTPSQVLSLSLSFATQSRTTKQPIPSLTSHPGPPRIMSLHKGLKILHLIR